MPLLVFLMFTFPILCHAQARLIGIVNTTAPLLLDADDVSLPLDMTKGNN